MMKKLYILLFVSLGAIFFAQEAQAQSNWEVGVRFGDEFSAEATIPIGASPRLHPVVYFDRFGIGTYFDWMFALSDGPTGLKFYPGVGPELYFGNNFDFDIAGNFGAEYSFKFPLTVAFDWRPGFRVTDSFNFKTNNWGISARFRFGEGTSFKKVD